MVGAGGHRSSVVMESLPDRGMESPPHPKCSYEIKRDANILTNKELDRLLGRDAEV